MPHEMVGFKELKSFNEKKREMFKHSDDITTQHIRYRCDTDSSFAAHYENSF